MCGIVGYIGNKSAVSVLMVGLTKLEYRGYDSSGVAVVNGDGVHLRRSVGKLQALKDSLHDEPVDGHIGIAHTRWATHGEPNENNSHPHRDATETVFVCHNGIIENYAELRAELEAQGVAFRSQTDTEVLPNLIKRAFDECGDLPGAVRHALARVRGSYAIAVLHKNLPDTLVAARQMSPLVLGLGQEENFFASDVPAILNATQRIIFLDDGEMAVLHRDKVEVFDLDDGKARRKSVEKIDWSPEQAEKGGYTHFMLKEIHEQPDVINRILSRYTNPERTHIYLDQIGLSADELRGIRRIFIQACGTSWHASLVGKYLLEQLAGIPTLVEYASEFRYAPPPLTPNVLTIGVTQSGETADTLSALNMERQRRSTLEPKFQPRMLGITNRPDSTIAHLVDHLIDTQAGIEIGVAATKTFTAQLIAFYCLALDLAYRRQTLPLDRIEEILDGLRQLPAQIEAILESQERYIEQLAHDFAETQDFIFLGRGINFPIALEGALKLKEISYIHAEGYPSGEMKHGPIALLDAKVPVVAIAVPGSVYEKVLSNAQEAKARDARLIGVTEMNDAEAAEVFDNLLPVPAVDELLSPLLTVIPLQFLAYHIAARRGLDVDQPRNLAKSVTVE